MNEVALTKGWAVANDSTDGELIHTVRVFADRDAAIRYAAERNGVPVERQREVEFLCEEVPALELTIDAIDDMLAVGDWSVYEVEMCL